MAKRKKTLSYCGNCGKEQDIMETVVYPSKFYCSVCKKQIRLL